MRFAAAAVPLALFAVVARDARADDTIKHPGDHPHYSVELEPHFDFGWAQHVYAGDSFGLGGRVSIPLTHEGFVSTINNSVAIGLGIDWLHFSDCFYYARFAYGYGCGADALYFPVVMQWNFYVAKHWSVFGEPGFYIYHVFANTDYCTIYGLGPYCVTPSLTGVDFAFWAGARYHFNDTVSLTMRIGYPTLSIGVSFMP